MFVFSEFLIQASCCDVDKKGRENSTELFCDTLIRNYTAELNFFNL